MQYCTALVLLHSALLAYFFWSSVDHKVYGSLSRYVTVFMQFVDVVTAHFISCLNKFVRCLILTLDHDTWL